MTKKVLLKNLITTFFQSIFATILILSLFNLAIAEERKSDNFAIFEDSINFGGGYSESDKYSLESTGGEIATGRSESDNFKLQSGYQAMNEVYLSLKTEEMVTLLPELGGVSGGVSDGELEVVTTTDNPAGYELLIKAETSPAMKKGIDTIADYETEASNVPDFAFEVKEGLAAFGYSVQGSDVISFWKNDGSECGIGSNSTARTCWFGASTTQQSIAQGNTNHPDGATTTVYFRVGVGSDANVSGGNYQAVMTITALAI